MIGTVEARDFPVVVPLPFIRQQQIVRVRIRAAGLPGHEKLHMYLDVYSNDT